MKGLLQRLFGAKPAASSKQPQPPRPSDLEALRAGLRQASDASNRDLRLRELADGLVAAGVSPSDQDEEAVWAWTVCRAIDKGKGLEWLVRVRDEEWLAHVAIQARAAEIRLAAAQRLTDPVRLKALAERVRDKDRGVYRHCQAILKTHAAGLQQTQAIAACSDRLREVLAHCPLSASKLYELRKEVAKLAEGPGLDACRDLLEQAGRREQEEARQVRDVEEAALQAKTLRRELERSSRPSNESLDAWKAAADQLRERLSARPEWLATAAAAQELAQTLPRIDARLAELVVQRDRYEACLAFLADLVPGQLDAAAVAAWSELPKPNEPVALAELEAQWRSLEPAGAAAPPPRERPLNSAVASPARDLEPVRQRLAELEQALEAGRTHDAAGLLRQLDEMEAAPLPRSMADRQRRAAGRLARLRDWARWGGSRVREDLLAAAEALLGDEVELAERAEAVPKLRAQWQRLDREGRAPAAQQRRFDELLGQAYQPVQAQRAEQAAQARAAREAKQAQLAEWEAWFHAIDWEQADFGELQKRRSAMRSQWRAMAHAGGRDERRLNAAFDALAEALSSRLEPVIADETARRERLIAGAERLQTVQSITEAVAQARNLQQQWKERGATVQLPRKVAEAQWQQFRQALDQVFARREAERGEQEARRQEHHAARQALLDELEAVLTGEPPLAKLEQELAGFRSRWEEAGQDESGRRRDDLDRRAGELQRRAMAALADLQQRKRRDVFDALAARSALAANLESAALAGELSEAKAADAEVEWQRLPGLPGEWERGLRERLHQASTVTAETLAAGSARRAAQLVDLEILLDLPTPPDFAADRQARQLELLQAGLQQRRSRAEAPGMVAGWYAIAAGDDAGQAERMGRIVERITARD